MTATMTVADEHGQDPLDEADLGAGQAQGAAAADHAALDLQRDIAAEQEERAVRHVDGAHEPEDEREPAGHDEVERRCGEPVEQRDEKVLGIVDRRAEARPVGDEQDPDDQEGDHHRDQAIAEHLGGARRQQSRHERQDRNRGSPGAVKRLSRIVPSPDRPPDAADSQTSARPRRRGPRRRQSAGRAPARCRSPMAMAGQPR